jgi:hypothetical protein
MMIETRTKCMENGAGTTAHELATSLQTEKIGPEVIVYKTTEKLRCVRWGLLDFAVEIYSGMAHSERFVDSKSELKLYIL